MRSRTRNSNFAKERTMSKVILLLVPAVVALVGFLDRAAAQDEPRRSAASEIGRYQLVTGQGHPLFLIDTATGNCWSRTGDGEWRDEGNPTKSSNRKAAQKSERSVPKLQLPEESIKMVVMQREERSIPGS